MEPARNKPETLNAWRNESNRINGSMSGCDESVGSLMGTAGMGALEADSGERKPSLLPSIARPRG